MCIFKFIETGGLGAATGYSLHLQVMTDGRSQGNRGRDKDYAGGFTAVLLMVLCSRSLENQPITAQQKTAR